MKSRVSFLEENNSIMTFAESNCETEGYKGDRVEFFRFKVKAFLKRAREGR